MSTATFERTMEQRLLALGRANEIRLGRAKVRREIGTRRLSAADVLLDPPECVLSMPIFELLMAQHRYGRSRSSGLLRRVRISEGRLIGALTDRERRLLAEALR